MFPISVKSFLIYPNRWWKTPESHLTLSSPSSPKAKPTPSPSVSYPKSRLHQTSLLPPPLPKATSPSSAFWATFLLLLLLLHLLQTNAHMATLLLTFCTRTDQNISNTLWHPEGVASVHFFKPDSCRSPPPCFSPPQAIICAARVHNTLPSLSSSSPSNSRNL